MIVYKGPVVEFIWSKGKSHQEAVANTDHSHFLSGIFMILISCFCWALFFIVQASTLREYPAELTLMTLICTLGAVESGAVAVAMTRIIEPWIISFATRLFTIVYSGVVCTGIAYYVQGIVSKERGPVFVTAFHRDDSQTWLSAAIANHETCKNGFIDFDTHSNVLTDLPFMMHNISESLSNALSVNKSTYASSGTNNNINRKLLSDGFPSWVSAAYRKLLQSSSVKAHLVVALRWFWKL